MTVPLFAFVVIAFTLGYLARYIQSRVRASSLELTLERKVLAAQEDAQRILAKAEEKAETLERETKQELSELKKRIETREEHILRKEETLDTRQFSLESETENVRTRIEEIKNIKAALDTRAAYIDTKLAEVAGLSKDEAYARMIRDLEKQNEADLLARLRKLETASGDAYDEKAKRLLTAAVHRIGNTLSPDIMTSTVEIPSEDIKGKIIGREGRNIRAFEHASGVDVLIDEQPGTVTLSSFDPVRREIARVALEALIADGRIQPAKIEEVLETARANVAETVRAMGEKAAFEAGVTGLHPDLVKILGRLHFRTSYGQNVLWHSVEMAHMAAILAEEIGADVAISRAGALLHDIGKTVSQEVAGTHVEIGIRILKKYDVDERVILAMRAHHEEYPYETIESMIVQVVDAISGGRPGARRDSLEHYIKRIREIEEIATEIPGVEKAFAISAGREVRIIVNPREVSDYGAEKLARDVAATIEERLRYPGEIKVHVIRETRVVTWAR
ncbi:ribonuclease Y [Candidatus Kaiserbacteria bacterium RIFCSPHIGHO2_02_FULL_49_34]|uniref:Ribonuclease Y n=1 Tax=Candidatus Kaiserbacteria bacterium RIFCSPHIGHO2_02_FULL_49_34 TaxID=1798491 RepID=A0A1F6DJF0_9BACT|nr:MAG: ribonuclease Y [Candidatus Kaiserbacteria bacterium RIFCSPHIGHO2_02_FULL_49_34]